MSKKIAIIDDDRVIQESLQDFFSDAGFSVFVAADGSSGLDLISRERPDLVVADILLPRMHGVALCEKLRASSDFRHIPIILMTGVYKDVNLRMYVHKGLADDFIEKPFRDKDLLTKIENLIGKAPGKAEVQPAACPDSVPEQSQKAQPGHSIDRDLDELVNWARSKDKK